MRSRAYYKLTEMCEAHRLLSRGERVVDLGCWPGGWLQAASGIVGPSGRVVGVDLAAVDPPLPDENVIALVGDLEDPEVCERIRRELGGPCDVLLSDAAPKLSGIREHDRANEERLLEAIEVLIPKLLRPHGDLLIKILEGPEAQQVDRRMRTLFRQAKMVKSRATRKGSSERYLLARGLIGPAPS